MKFNFLVLCGLSASFLVGCKTNTPKATHTVLWKNWDGTILETDRNVGDGEMPHYDGSEPTRSKTAEFSYTFNGWSSDLAPVYSDVEYVATFTQTTNKYTITFNSDGGSLIPSQSVEYGSKATEPTNPIKPKTDEYTYVFNYWQDENGIKFNFENTIIEKDITLKAIYKQTKNKYTITWKNEGEIIDSSLIEYGVNPAHQDPTHSKTIGHTYTFNGWFDSKGIQLTNQYKVTKNETFEAKWTDSLNKHTVKWINDNSPGTILETDLNVEFGSIPTYDQGKNPESTKTKIGYHYDFTGWKDGDGTSYSSSYKMPDKDVIFTAQYKEEINKYTVNFIAGANVTLSGTKKFTVDYKTTFNNIPNKPTASTITGYTLKDGFYRKNSLEEFEKVLDTYEIVSDVDFYALADINKYNVKFDLNGAPGTAPTTQTINYNNKVTKPTNPTWEKYRFDGWYEKNGSVLKQNPWNFTTDTVVSDVTLYAKWSEATFATDWWSNVISYAETGIDKLHEVYKTDCDNNADYPGTLIGLERDLQISGGKIHKVRVIDESHDYLVSDYTKYTALTFEFSTLLSSSKDGTALTSTYSLREDLTYDNTWSTSVLAQSMNSVSTIINNSLGGHIKEVVKGTVDIPSSKYKGYRSYCFPLSVAEIGASAQGAYSSEGTVYKYYQGEETQIKPKRIKKDVAGNTPTWYWLRSPEVGTTKHAFYVYNGTPITGEPGYVASFITCMSLAVSCAFCI